MTTISNEELSALFAECKENHHVPGHSVYKLAYTLQEANKKLESAESTISTLRRDLELAKQGAALAVEAEERARKAEAERDVLLIVLMQYEPCPVARAPESFGHAFLKGEFCVVCVAEKERREPCWLEWAAQQAAGRETGE